MRINNNLQAMNTHRQLGIANNANSKSMEKLSSGFRINRAGDDAAGLSISEKMRGQIRGLNMASKNAQDGISMIQTAEGSLNEAQNIVQRMRELSVQAANDTNVSTDRTALQNEVTELMAEVKRIADDTQFNKQTLLDGTAGDAGKVKIQVGANADEAVEFDFAAAINLTTIHTTMGTPDITTQAGANTAITTFETALQSISDGRSKLGAWQNRLEHTIKNLDNTSENLQASESRIRDVDMAKEVMEQTKQSILSQASQAMLAQANQSPQNVLSLLR